MTIIKIYNNLRTAIRLFCTLATASLISIAASAQTKTEALTKATTALNNGKYYEAYTALAPHTNETERDAKTNFIMGAAEAMTGINLDDALRRLKTAQLRNYQKNNAFLYIGRAYQLKCEYEQANTAYEKFIHTSDNDSLVATATRYAADCQNATTIAAKIFALKVINKTRTTTSNLLTAYHASKEAGTVCHNSDFFQSDIDPNGIMYITERADAAYFSLPNDAGYENLMKMEKLIGGWSDMTQLRGTTATDANDKMPFLMTDGTTLYFASDRLGGMGGMDIYRTTYDAETRTFSAPVNMGVPFNSPADDYLFVADETEERAWFASNRETLSTDSIVVYEILWDDSVIRSMAQTTEDIATAMSLQLATDAENYASAQTSDAQDNIKQSTTAVKNQEVFKLVICDSLTYTQWEHFRSAKAARTYKQVLSAQDEKAAQMKKMGTLRKEFMELSGSTERNEKLKELLQIERSIYTLDDEIAEKTEAARHEEVLEVNMQIAQGTYKPLNQISVQLTDSNIDWQSWLKQENFSVYSDVYFKDARLAVDEEVRELFSVAERTALEEQDSLMAWATIITMEAEKIEGLCREADNIMATGQDGKTKTMTADEALEMTRNFRTAAAMLTSQAQDAKKEIYDARYAKIIASLSDYDTSEITDLHNKAMRTYATVKETDVATATPAKIETLLLMKRRTMTQYDKTLERYVAHADGTQPLPSLTTETTGPTPTDAPDPTTTTTTEPETQQTTDTQSTKQTTNETLNFRIQLGAFRNRPAALDTMPDPTNVQTVEIEGKGLTRYYYGHYATAEDAAADVELAKKAGFNGAFATSK